MIIVTGGRQSGKTTACVRWLLEDPGSRTLIVADQNRREHVLYALREAFDYPHWPDRVRTVRDFADMMRGRGIGGQIGIDDLEAVLQNMFGGRVEFAAVNSTCLELAQRPKEEPSYYPPDKD